MSTSSKLLGIALLTGVMYGPAAAGEPATPAAAVNEQSGSPGQALYQTYCASCHGSDARGSGPVAPALLTKPPDLTRLTRKHGIPLDRKRIAEFIDGRLDVLAHGPRDMPVWGERFKEELDPGLPATEDTTRRIIDRIVDYLMSIQSLQGATTTGGEPHVDS
jgi:mono/diheme cytochrome c family protein